MKALSKVSFDQVLGACYWAKAEIQNENVVEAAGIEPASKGCDQCDLHV